MTAPTITGLDAISLIEGHAAINIGQDLSFSGGADFTGGFLRFEVSDPNSGDQLKLTSAGDVNAAGAISVDAAGFVYLGDGSGREAIGTVDAVENGQNGAALKINIGVSTGAIGNTGFEGGTDGWTIVTQRVILGETEIGGHVTPTDLTIPPNAGDDAGPATLTYNFELSTSDHTEGSSSLRLYNLGNTGAGFDVVHGPYAVSDTFEANAGEVFRFDWRAAAGGDAYDAYGYLLNVDTGETVTVLDATGVDDTGETAWTSAAVEVPETGDWAFVFVAGTYDFSGGQAVGGSLFIDNIRTLTPSSVDDAILQTIASQVTFQNTSNEAVDTRTIGVSVADGEGDQETASADLDITNTPNEPSQPRLAGSPRLGDTLSLASPVSDPDGLDPAGVTYQWQQRQSDGSWADIDGATGATYVLTADDVGHSVRLVAQYTDNGGDDETVTSYATSLVRDPAAPRPPPAPTEIDEHANTATGTIGSDSISGLEGDDTLSGGGADDFINGDQQNDIVQGNQGSDTLHGGQGDDIVRGGQDDDRVLGDKGNDQVFGDLGRDVVNGGDGDDVLWGGQGASPDTGDAGDTVSGEAGADFLNGNGGDDALDGGVGNDTVHGGQGADLIYGGEGDDIVLGDFGNDTVSGGAGADEFQMHGGGRDVIVDFSLAQGDRIFLDAGASHTVSQQGADTVIDWSEGQVVLIGVQLSSLTGDWLVA
ncbi:MULTISPECIES: calcium-binding protein [Phenylobacterium]|uniref:Ca2+-binding RTX toxin-like protein n=1 Tax=Phenylobacterium koreense TaxID=266125 RepID=A0ABV2EG87_9CAUL